MKVTVTILCGLMILASYSFCFGQNIGHWLDQEEAINYLEDIILDFQFLEDENPQKVEFEVKRSPDGCIVVKASLRYADGYEFRSREKICK